MEVQVPGSGRHGTGGATLRPELPAHTLRESALPPALRGLRESLSYRRGVRSAGRGEAAGHPCRSGSWRRPSGWRLPGLRPRRPPGAVRAPALPVGPEGLRRVGIHSLSVFLVLLPFKAHLASGASLSAASLSPGLCWQHHLPSSCPTLPATSGRVINAPDTPPTFILAMGPFGGRGAGRSKGGHGWKAGRHSSPRQARPAAQRAAQRTCGES